MSQHEFIDLPPLMSVHGTVRLPGSKSISNRILLLLALAQGTAIDASVQRRALFDFAWSAAAWSDEQRREPRRGGKPGSPFSSGI